MCVRCIFNSVCASAQSDQSLSFPTEEMLDPPLSVERPRLRVDCHDKRICLLVPFDVHRLK